MPRQPDSPLQPKEGERRRARKGAADTTGPQTGTQRRAWREPLADGRQGVRASAREQARRRQAGRGGKPQKKKSGPKTAVVAKQRAAASRARAPDGDAARQAPEDTAQAHTAAASTEFMALRRAAAEGARGVQKLLLLVSWTAKSVSCANEAHAAAWRARTLHAAAWRTRPARQRARRRRCGAGAAGARRRRGRRR
jgi:hypothetical protein